MTESRINARAAVLFPAPLYFDGVQYSTDAITFRSILNWGKLYSALDIICFYKLDRTIKGKYSLSMDAANIIGLPYARERMQWHLTKAPSILVQLISLLWVNRNKWDFVVLFDPYFPNWAAYSFCRLFKIPVSLRMTGRYDLWIFETLRYEGLFKKVIGTIYSRFIRGIESHIAKQYRVVTDGDKNFTSNRFHDRINFCVETTLKDSDLKEQSGNTINSIISDNFHLLSVSRLHPAKGLEYLIEAIIYLRRLKLPIQLSIVGPTYGWKYGGYEHRLRKLIDDSGMGNAIRIIGWVRDEQMKNIWLSAHAFIVPYVTNADGVPRVILEAMAKGIPIIATRVGGIPNVVTNGVNGIMVSPKSVNEIASAVKRLYAEPIFRNHLATKGLESAKLYSEKIVSNKIASLLYKAAKIQI